MLEIKSVIKCFFFPNRTLGYARYVTAGIFLSLFVFCILYISFVWTTGKTVNQSIGGYYQVSDAQGYWICANALLEQGWFGPPQLTGEVCQRRAIYPTLLAGITWVANQNILGVLLLQASIALLAIGLFVRRATKYIGIAGSLICSGLLFMWAKENLFLQAMSENAGLIFGTAGLATLLIASERRSLSWTVIGISLFSVALNARAGAFFILPMLVIWAGITAHIYQQRLWHWLAAAASASIFGFALQSLLILAIGGSPSNSHGNFSYILYGLSVGGQGWQRVLIDHPEIAGSDAVMTKAIYALALDNLLNQPKYFLVGLKKGIGMFLASGTYGSEKLGLFSFIFKACWWLAWVPFFVNRRNPTYLLLALSSLGVVLSAPLLLQDGGSRVFAASVAIDVFQVAIGLWWLSIILMKGFEQGLLPATNLSATNGKPESTVSLEMVFVVFLFLLLLIPHTPFRHLTFAPQLRPIGCSGPEIVVIARIGKETMTLNITGDNESTDFLIGQIRHEDYVAGIPALAWYRESALAFRGKSLLTVYQLDRADAYAPGPYTLFSNDNLNEYFGRTVQLCIDRQEQKQIFGNTYRKINSIAALD